MTISVINTNTPLVPSAGLLDELRGAACLEQVWSFQYLPGEKSHRPGSLGLLTTSPLREKRALPEKPPG